MPQLLKSNIPDPEYTEFFGRDREIANLKQMLSPHFRPYIIAVEGLGGIGKTALAIEVCRYFHKQYSQLPEEERYHHIVWTSAKVEDMTPQGTTPRSAMQNTLSSIYAKIAEVLEIPNRLSLNEEKLLETIYLYLAKKRSLLVIDSFEQLENPSAITKFLKEIPPPSKAVITTRPQQTIPNVESLILEGLGIEESAKLVAQLDTDDSMNFEQRMEIAQKSSGVPLVIKWAMGRITNGDAYSSVLKKLKQGDLQLSQYCVADSLAFIKGRKAEEIVFALLPLVSPVKVQTIGEIVELSRDVKTRDFEIDLLVKLQLVSKSKSDKISLVSLARATLLEEYLKTKQEKISKKWANYYLQFLTGILGRHGRVDGYSDSLQRALTELDNLVEILEDIGEYDPRLYCDLLEAARYILYMRGNWLERDIFLVRGHDLSQKIQSWCQLLLFASDLAWVATYRLQHDRSLQFFNSAKPALEKCDQHYYRAKYYMDLGRYYQLSAIQDADYADSENNYFLALDEAKSADSPTIQCTCLYYLGLLYYEIGNKTEAKLRFEQGVEIALNQNASREADRHQSMLAVILAESGQYIESRKIFERIVANAEGGKDKVRQADYILAMATAEYTSGNRQGATALLNQAEDIYSELGRNQEVEDIKQLRREKGLE